MPFSGINTNSLLINDEDCGKLPETRLYPVFVKLCRRVSLVANSANGSPCQVCGLSPPSIVQVTLSIV